jgi:hypothetical protein
MKISNETKIGALTVIAITILVLGYSFLKGNDVFSGSNKFYAVYNSVEGLNRIKTCTGKWFPDWPHLENGTSAGWPYHS